MRRIVALLAGTVLASVGFLRGAAAGADPLTPEMQKAVDASLLVFSGEIAKVGPVPQQAAEAGARQWVAYRVDSVLKGVFAEKTAAVQHVIAEQPGFDAKAPQLDPVRFAAGRRVIVGARLEHADAASYVLVCGQGVLRPIERSESLERAIAEEVRGAAARQAPGAPSGARELATCTDNLSQLAGLFTMRLQANRAKAQKYGGPALWLCMRKNAAAIRRGDERLLLCPADPVVRVPTTDEERKAWDDVDLDRPVPGLCSYAGRDFKLFPLNIESKELQPVGACLHHDGGAVVAFDDGHAAFLNLSELGISSEEQKVVGPDSKSRILRTLR